MKEEIIEKLCEILELDSINSSDDLENFDEWDSLTSLSLIAMADSDYGVTLSNDIVESFVTVEDVVNYIINNV